MRWSEAAFAIRLASVRACGTKLRVKLRSYRLGSRGVADDPVETDLYVRIVDGSHPLTIGFGTVDICKDW